MSNRNRISTRHKKKYVHAFTILVLIALAFMSTETRAQIAPSAWPKVLGNPQNTSLSTGFGTVPILKWLNPNAMGTPIIGPEGTVYASWLDTTAVDGQTGATKYNSTVPLGLTSACFALGADGFLFSTYAPSDFGAINSLNGNLVWTQSNLGDVETSGFFNSNIGLDGTVFVAPLVGSKGTLFGLQPATGSIRWAFGLGSLAATDPTVGTDGTIYEGFDTGQLYAINPSSGTAIWSSSFSSFLSQISAGSNGNLYFASTDIHNNLIANALDAKTGASKWSTNLGSFQASWFYSLSLGPDNSVILVSFAYELGPTTAETLTVVDGTTGAVRWSIQTDSQVTPVVGADGTIYIGASNAINAFNGQTGDLVWTYPFGKTISYVGCSSPVTDGHGVYCVMAMNADGLLYISTGDGLYCLDSEHVTSVAISPSSVLGGLTATGTVTVSYPAPAGGALVKLASPNASVSFPTSVTIPAGKTSATFTISTIPVDTQTVAVFTATPGNSQTASLTINPAVLSGMTLNPTTVQGGGTSIGTVTLGSPAGPSGFSVALASSNSSVSAPNSVTVPRGQTSATFSVTTSGVNAATATTITATSGSNQFSQTLTITPASLSLFALNPTSVQGGASSTGTITLTGPAGPSGVIVTLASASSSATVPATVTIPSGKSTATFTVSTTPVGAQTTALITATLSNQPLTATLTIMPATLVSMSLAPATVLGGNTSTGTVTLSGAAPTGGTSIVLASSSSAAMVPSSVLVPAGQSSATFNVTTTGVNSLVTATVKGTLSGLSQSATLTITPTALVSISLSPASVQGGVPSTGTVMLTGPAGSGGTTVTLSSNTPAATVPNSVTVPSGQTTATFKVTSLGVNAQTTAIITGTLTGISQNANLTITPVGLQSFTVSPSTVFGGNSSTGTITLNGPAGIGGSTVNLGSSSSSVTPPGSVTVAQGQTSSTVQIQTSAVTSTVAATVAANLNGTTSSALLTVTAPVLQSLTISPSTLAGVGSAKGTVTFSGVAPPSGIMVNLLSSSPSASVQSTVTIPSGQSSASFSISAISVSSLTTVTITATANFISKSATLTLNPIELVSLNLNPNTVNGGSSSIGTVSLNGPAGKGGSVIHLKSSLAGVVVPLTATIPLGQTSVTFKATTVGVSSQKVATITATLGAVTETATLTVNPPVLSGISLTPSTVTGSQTSTATVTLSGSAPSTGIVVKLTCSSTNASVPVSVTIPSGKSSATFTVKTIVVSAQSSASISAALNGVTETATLTINPPTVLSLTLSPASVKGGSSSTGKVTLNVASPKGELVVTLSAGQSDATVPASITVAAGSTSSTFTIKTGKVTAKTTATISATATGTTKSAVLAITP